MWQAFKNYFVTAQLIAGGAIAVQVYKEGIWGMLLAFAITAPVVAILCLGKVAFDRWKARRPPR